jgi:replicative DNA helicase
MSEALDHQLPQDRDAERAVVCAKLWDTHGEYGDRITEIVGVDGRAFGDERNALLWDTIQAMRKAHEPYTDQLAIKAKLVAAGQWDRIGKEYLYDVSCAVAGAPWGPKHAEIVRDKYLSRELYRIAVRAMEAECDGRGDLHGRIAAVAKAIEALQEQTVRNVATDCETLLEQVYGELDKPSRTVQTGFRELDDILGGLEPEELCIVAGRTSAGKTSFAMSLTENLLDRGLRVLFYSVEMSGRQLMQRFLCSRSAVAMSALKNRDYTPAQRASMDGARDALSRHRLLIDDSRPIRIGELCAKARVVHKRSPVDAVVVDYIQKVKPDSKLERRDMDVGSIAEGLKDLSVTLSIPVIGLAQLNRVAAEEKPALHHLRESGELEQHTDTALLLWNKDGVPDAPTRQVIVGKNRNGRTGDAELRWIPSRMRFDDYAPGYAPPVPQAVVEPPDREWWP